VVKQSGIARLSYCDLGMIFHSNIYTFSINLRPMFEMGIKYRFSLNIILLILCLCGFRPIYAASPLDSFPALMDTLMGGHYAAADSIADQMQAAFPGHPAPFYARAAIHYAHIRDFEDSAGHAAFAQAVDSCLILCDKYEADPLSIRAEIAFVRGSALAVKGFLAKFDGHLLSGIKSVIRAKNAFDDAIAADPAMYDAYLGRGAYRYGVARYAKLITWLPMIPSAEEGWRDIWLAIENSKFSKYAAFSSIVWFLIEDKNYSLADSICKVSLARFPNSRTFLSPSLALAERQDHYAEAESLALNLVQQYSALPSTNGYELTGLYWRLMKLAHEQDSSEDAFLYAQKGLAVYRTPDIEKKRRTKIEEMRARITQ
jgi:tetratricopeptide (TPR) repeat protein